MIDGVLSRLGFEESAGIYIKKGNKSTASGQLMQLALTNPVVFACIEIRAKALSQVKFYQEVNKEKVFSGNDILDLLNKPNYFQSKQDLLKQFEWYKSVYGYVFLKPYEIGLNNKNIFALNPTNIEFEEKENGHLIFSDAEAKRHLNQKFKYQDGDKEKNLKLSEVIPFYDITNLLTDTNTHKSPSRLSSLLTAIQNINLALDAENVMIQQNGREMFWRDGVGGNLGTSLPLADDDRTSIQKVLSKLGLGKNKQRAIITASPIGHKSLHVKMKELGLSESVQSNIELIRSVFEIPSEVYDAYTKGKTYENQKEAGIGFIQNTIQQIADDVANSISNFYELDNPIKATFDHLPIMQHTEEKKANKVLKIAMAYEKLQRAGMDDGTINELFAGQGINIQPND